MTDVAHSLRVLLLVVLVGGAVRTVFAAEPEEFTIARPGNLPILLTAPHGGLDGVPNVPRRSRGTTSTDMHTTELTEALAKQIENVVRAKPYVLIARFSRRYIDANRAPGEAFDSKDAKPFYDAYHNRARHFVSQLKQRFPQGALLLDIHGQSSDPGVTHRGTGNGATVAHLMRAHGSAALIGPNSIFGTLQKKGVKIFPQNTPIDNPPEDRRFNGGYTVRTYGSGKPDGIDAIQIEVGRDIRTDPQFIAALAEGIVVFYRAYLASP